MDSKHTPGPWKHFCIAHEKIDLGYEILTADERTFITGGTSHGSVRYEANARLIAAAPDLLEACKQFIDEWHANNQNFYRLEPKSLTMMRAAIAKAAKAEGEIR